MGKSWLSSAWHTGLSDGASDSVRCPRLADIEPTALRNRRSCTAINHRTVRWCTGLSGEPTAPAANGRPRDQRATHGQLQRSAGCTGVSGAPTSPEEQRSDAPDMEGDCAPDMNSGCPVVRRTVRCTTGQKAGIAFQVGLQRLQAALGL
jgi:hypothetical protein